ncbi:MAG: DUF4278 domain-containing protein [Prochlorothrix sp.]|nr:DUF4278 domain-containing protein [Prochlorothrix sp.]
MKMTYRGMTYDYTPPAVETKKGELVGRYRGLDWRFCGKAKSYVQQPSLDLVYRGAAYNTQQQPVAAPENRPTLAPVPALTATSDRARQLVVNHQVAIKKRQQAMMTRLAAEVGLTAREAGSYWNRIQGKVHPSFRGSYDRSAAAMS